MVLDSVLTLSNGVEVPQLGLGTWLIEDGKTAQAVRDAVSVGYRHFDTAQAYGNERGVGEGIRTCGVPRDRLFVTTKVAAEHKTYESAADSIDESLKRSGLDYFDLIIVHSPQPWAEVNQSEDRHYEGNVLAWRALEDAYRAGKVRAIGVSNFLESDVENLRNHCTVQPMVNQVLAHVGNTPFELVDYCRSVGVAVEAYSPIAHGEIIEQPALEEMAGRYCVTIPQLCIRYTLQLGLISLPKTCNPIRMQSNARLDFEISAEDMDTLKGYNGMVDYGKSAVFPVYGGRL